MTVKLNKSGQWEGKGAHFSMIKVSAHDSNYIDIQSESLCAAP